MSGSLSLSPTLTLTHFSTIRSTVAVSARRNHSNQPEIGVARTKKETDKGLKEFMDLLNIIIIKDWQPGWLPLVPGGSYWVPPESLCQRATDSMTAEEFMNSNRSSNSPLEEETDSKNSNQSEEDEG